MVENKKMQIAYKQVNQFLNLYNQELLKLTIPEDVLIFLRENADKDYEFNITPDTFNADSFSEEALSVLLLLFRDYFADERQKNIINNFSKKNTLTNLAYNNKLFKNQKYESSYISKINEQHITFDNNALVVYKNSGFFSNIILKIKSFFKRKV